MVKPGYKQTDVGTIPEDWGVVSLGDYVDIYSGESPSRYRLTTSGIPYFKVEQLNDDPKYLISTPYYFLKGKTVKCGSVIFPKRGASILLNKIRILLERSFMDTNLMALTVSDELWNEYLFYCLVYTGLARVADTTSIPQINNKHIIPFKIAYPKLKEQKAIAEALSDVDGLIASLEKLIAKKRDIKTGTMQQLLTGKKRLTGFGEGKGYKQTELGEIPEDWETIPMGELVDFINGRAYGLHEWETSGTPVIRLQNLTGSGENYYYSNIDLPEKQYCNYGDLLFMWSATFGPVFWKGGKAIFHYHIWKIACTLGIDKQYLYYKLDEMTENLKRRSSSGGTMLHVTKEKMEATKIACPDISEQEAISSILMAMDEELDTYNSKLIKTKSIKQGMMQELLTGRTRLVNPSEVAVEKERLHGT